MDQLDGNLSAQLGRIHHIIMRNIEAKLSPSMEQFITPPQIRTILFLDSVPEHTVICQRDLEEAFDLKPPSVSLLLRNMEKGGLICRKPVAGDGRLKSVSLTPHAKTLSHALQSGFDEIEDAIAKDITPVELEIFFSVLKKIRKNLE